MSILGQANYYISDPTAPTVEEHAQPALKKYITNLLENFSYKLRYKVVWRQKIRYSSADDIEDPDLR